MIYFAWLKNNTDSRDDEPLKISAKTKQEAYKIAANHLENRFTIGFVYTRQEFKKFDPWWHSVEWGKSAVTC